MLNLIGKRSGRVKISTLLWMLLLVQSLIYLSTYTIYSDSDSLPFSLILTGMALDVLIISLLVYDVKKKKEITIGVFSVYFLSTGYMVCMFALLYTNTGVSLTDGGLVVDFFSCLYFSVVTWTSLGYGDIHPTESSRIWVMIEVFFGYIHMGLLVGLILEYVTKKKGG